MLSRLQNALAGRPAPWSHAMAVELQTIMNRSRTDEGCCGTADPAWEIQCVRCQSCQAVLSRMARPDLGRPRSDGRIRGTVRMLVTDGYPMSDPLPEPKTEQE